jgi:hypothetical protein
MTGDDAPASTTPAKPELPAAVDPHA